MARRTARRTSTDDRIGDHPRQPPAPDVTLSRVAKWVYETAARRTDAEFELVDRSTTSSPCSTRRCRRRWANTPSRTPTSGPRRSPLRRLRDGHPRVQPLHLGRAEERHRLPLPGVEQQGWSVSSATARSAAPARSNTLRLIAGELMLPTSGLRWHCRCSTDFENFMRIQARRAPRVPGPEHGAGPGRGLEHRTLVAAGRRLTRYTTRCGALGRTPDGRSHLTRGEPGRATAQSNRRRGDHPAATITGPPRPR